MKHVYNTNFEANDFDIDISYYEKWLNLYTTLNQNQIDNMIEDVFEDKYLFNSHIKKVFTDKIRIEELVDAKLLNHFNQLNNDFEKYRLYILEQGEYDTSIIAWPFTYYATTYFKEKFGNLVNKQSLVILKSIELITIEIMKLAIKMHIVQLNEFENYDLYQKEKRYHDFLTEEVISSEFIEKFYVSRPLLLARCLNRTDLLLTFCQEVIVNIGKHFDIGKIKTLEFGLGDTHSGGKTVVNFSLDDGTSWFYKPKNLHIEKVFTEFLDLFEVPHQSLSENIYQSDYSIVKKVDYLPLVKLEDASIYYRNLGKLQFILYLLGANDIHYENIIAHGTTPTIIDLETLFQNNYDVTDFKDFDLNCRSKNATELLQNIGILPMKLKSGDGGFEISALSGDAQDNVFKKEQVVNYNSMDLEVIEAYIGADSQKNIPYCLNNTKVNYQDYVDDIILGFQEISRLFFEIKEKTNNFIKHIPDEIRVRNVLRPTQVYYDFLFFSNHPTYLTNIVRYHKFLENLIGLPYTNYKINIAEMTDISNEDIPCFFSKIGHKEIFDANFNSLGVFWTETPKNKVLNRIENLTEETIDELKTNLLIHLGKYHSLETKTKSTFNDLIDKIKKQGVFYKTVLLSKEGIVFETLQYGLFNGIIGLWFYLQSYPDKSEEIENILQRIENSLSIFDAIDLNIDENLLFSESSILFYYIAKYQMTGKNLYKMKVQKMLGSFDKQLRNAIFTLNIDVQENVEINHKIGKLKIPDIENFKETLENNFLDFSEIKNNIAENLGISLEGIYENTYH